MEQQIVTVTPDPTGKGRLPRMSVRARLRKLEELEMVSPFVIRDEDGGYRLKWSGNKQGSYVDYNRVGDVTRCRVAPNLDDDSPAVIKAATRMGDRRLQYLRHECPTTAKQLASFLTRRANRPVVQSVMVNS